MRIWLLFHCFEASSVDYFAKRGFCNLLVVSGVVFQPLLGKAADVWNYPASYVFCAVIQVLALPFTWLARQEKAASDAITSKNGGKRQVELAASGSRK